MNPRNVWGLIIIFLSVALGLRAFYEFYIFVEVSWTFLGFDNTWTAHYFDVIDAPTYGFSPFRAILARGGLVVILGYVAYIGAIRGTSLLEP